MSSSINRMIAEMKRALDVEHLEKEVSDIRKQNEKLVSEIRDMSKEFRAMQRRMDSLENGSKKPKTPALIEIIEEKMTEFKDTVKVVELREKLQDDDRVKSRAENFYAVIATAMNNSAKFEKIGAGEYKYLSDGASH